MPVSVIITTPEEVADPALLSGEHHGSYELETNTIRLHKDSCVQAEMRNSLLCHELVHAWIEQTGAANLLMTKLGMTPDQFVAFEEELVNHLAPAVHTSAKDLARLMASKVGVSK